MGGHVTAMSDSHGKDISSDALLRSQHDQGIKDDKQFLSGLHKVCSHIMARVERLSRGKPHVRITDLFLLQWQ